MPNGFWCTKSVCFQYVPCEHAPKKMKNVGGEPYFSKKYVPLVHHGAQCRSMVHNVALYRWNGAQLRFHKPKSKDRQHLLSNDRAYWPSYYSINYTQFAIQIQLGPDSTGLLCLMGKQLWQQFSMKMPERSCPSRVGHFLVLMPQNLLCDVIWRHNVTSHRSSGLVVRMRTDTHPRTPKRLRFCDLDRWRGNKRNVFSVITWPGTHHWALGRIPPMYGSHLWWPPQLVTNEFPVMYI